MRRRRWHGSSFHRMKPNSTPKALALCLFAASSAFAQDAKVTVPGQPAAAPAAVAAAPTYTDAQLLEERPYELISWQSLPGADVENAGSVWFTPAPDQRGTIVKLTLKYALPGGKLASAFSRLFGRAAGIDIHLDLLQLKSLLETGEIPKAQHRPRKG